MSAPHLAKQTFAHTREGAALTKVPTVTYTDHKPFAFEILQDVIVIKPDSPFKGMTGQVTSRRSGKPNKYTVRIGTVNAPTPLFPFTEDELTAFRALPVPMWVTEGRWVDRVIVFGRTFQADDPIAARLMAREGAIKKRQAAKRIASQDAICLPKWTQTTAREAVAPLIRAKIRQDYIKHIENRLSMRVRGIAA